jgi:small subunit ribosomal protein S18
MKVRTRQSKSRGNVKRISHFRKRCRFCKNNAKYIDYKDIKLLERYVTERGKIASRRFSGNCAKHQRLVAGAIKKARFVALLPYIR